MVGTGPSHQIKSRHEFDGSVYELPRRALGKERWSGLVVIAIGATFASMGGGWVLPQFLEGLHASGSERWFIMLFSLLGLPFLVIGLGLLLFGALIVLNCSHGEVRVTREQLCYTERAGPLKWTWRRDLADVDKLVLTRKLLRSTPSASDDGLPERASFDSYVLRTEGTGVKPMLVAPGYPRAMIAPLADELTHRLGAARRGLVGRDEAAEVSLTEEVLPSEVQDPNRPWEPEEIPPAPEGEHIVFNEHSDGCAFLFRPVGVWRGSKGLMFFALLWNGFVFLFLGVMVNEAISGTAGGDPVPWLVWVLMSLFPLVGVYVLVLALSMGRRQAAIVVDGEEVAIKRIGLFRQSEQRYLASDLNAIRVGPSGMSVNDVPVMELQFVPKDGGSTLGLLSQQLDKDLEWVAASLRNQLKVGRQTS